MESGWVRKDLKGADGCVPVGRGRDSEGEEDGYEKEDEMEMGRHFGVVDGEFCNGKGWSKLWPRREVDYIKT